MKAVKRSRGAGVSARAGFLFLPSGVGGLRIGNLTRDGVYVQRDKPLEPRIVLMAQVTRAQQ